MFVFFFFFQAEDGIRDAQESRGLGDVYKRQSLGSPRPTCRCFADGPARAVRPPWSATAAAGHLSSPAARSPRPRCCLLYTSDAADEEDSVDLGGRRIIKKKKT